MPIISEENYRLHETNYIFEHFRNRMTETEMRTDDLVLSFWENEDTGAIVFNHNARIDFDTAPIELALREGVPAFRRRTAERLLASHRDDIYAKACPECGRLPTPPKSKQCVWCSGSWFQARLEKNFSPAEGRESESSEPEAYEVDLTMMQRHRINETEDARYTDWILEIEGRPVALLSDARFDDMFWVSYVFTPVTDAPEMLAQFEGDTFWPASENVVWRNQELGLAATSAWNSVRRDGRIAMRALYLSVDRWVPQPEVEPPKGWGKGWAWLKS